MNDTRLDAFDPGLLAKRIGKIDEKGKGKNEQENKGLWLMHGLENLIVLNAFNDYDSVGRLLRSFEH